MRYIEEDHDLVADAESSHKARRRAAEQARAYLGPLSDDDLDTLEFEEEFETFERLRPNRRRRERGGARS